MQKKRKIIVLKKQKDFKDEQRELSEGPDSEEGNPVKHGVPQGNGLPRIRPSPQHRLILGVEGNEEKASRILLAPEGILKA